MVKILENEEEILQKIIDISEVCKNNKDEIIKARFVQNIFFEYGIKDVKIDPVGNVIGKIEGSVEESLVIFADLNNIYSKKCKVTMRDIVGKGVATVSYPLFSLGEIAKLYLKERNIKFNLIIVGLTGGEKDFKGMEFFLENNDEKIKGVIYLKGAEEGRIEKSTTSSLKAELVVKNVENNYLSRNKRSYIIVKISKLISKISDEEQVDQYNIYVESVEKANEEYEKYIVKLNLTGNTLNEVFEGKKLIEEIVAGLTNEDGIIIESRFFYGREGIKSIKDGLYNVYFEMLKQKGFKIFSLNENSAITLPIENSIDTVCIGIGKGGNLGMENEYIEIKSIYRGIEIIYEGLQQFEKEN